MSREILETKNRQGLNLIERALLAALFLAILFSFTGFAVRCEDVSQEVLRLHVLANSDSEEDQELIATYGKKVDFTDLSSVEKIQVLLK